MAAGDVTRPIGVLATAAPQDGGGRLRAVAFAVLRPKHLSKFVFNWNSTLKLSGNYVKSFSEEF